MNIKIWFNKETILFYRMYNFFIKVPKISLISFWGYSYIDWKILYSSCIDISWKIKSNWLIIVYDRLF